MPGTASGLPYPLGTDELRLGADAIEDLARAFLPQALPCDYVAGDGSGLDVTNWQVTSSSVRRAGMLVHVEGVVKRITAALTVPANGNVGNAIVGNLFGNGMAPPLPYALTAIGSGSTGRQAQWAVRNQGGIHQLLLLSVATASDIAVNEQLSFNGLFLASTYAAAP